MVNSALLYTQTRENKNEQRKNNLDIIDNNCVIN